jgi:hypothetical protein
MSIGDPRRRLVSYPKPHYANLVHAESELSEGDETVSEIVAKALKLYYDSMPPEQKAVLLECAARISKNTY